MQAKDILKDDRGLSAKNFRSCLECSLPVNENGTKESVTQKNEAVTLKDLIC